MGSLIVFRDLDLPETAETISGLVLSREREAHRHWVFGTDEAEFRSIAGTGETANIHQGAPTLGANFVTVTSGTSLRTEYFKANNFSIFLVGRHTAASGGNLFAGNYSNLDPTVSGWYMATDNDASGRLFFRWAPQSGGSAQSTKTLTMSNPSLNGWIAMGMSLGASSGLIYSPQCGPISAVHAHAVAISNAVHDQFFLGSRAYHTGGTGVNYGDNTADLAEFIIFDSALTLQQLQAVYQRSVGRMSARGITIG